MSQLNRELTGTSISFSLSAMFLMCTKTYFKIFYLTIAKSQS